MRSLKVGVYSYKEVAIYNPNDKKAWKFKDALADEMHVPLEVYPVFPLMDSKKSKGKTIEVRFIRNPTSVDLIKQIGSVAYVDGVKLLSQHPLIKPLADGGLQKAMGASDILFAMRVSRSSKAPSLTAAPSLRTAPLAV